MIMGAHTTQYLFIMASVAHIKLYIILYKPCMHTFMQNHMHTCSYIVCRNMHDMHANKQ